MGWLLCLICWHDWDGHTHEDYPAPQCRRCKKWHWRKKFDDSLNRIATPTILKITVVLIPGCCILLLALLCKGCGDSKPQNILPRPYYTNNHGQSVILLRRSKVEPWLKAHPNAKIISIGVARVGAHTIVYEEAKATGE